MKVFIVLAFLISNFCFASTWEFRTAKSLDSLEQQPWQQFPNKGNPIAREYEGYIEYKSTFFSEEISQEVGLYLGLIGDADKAFVNGVQVGQSGNFPPNYSYNMDTERTYFLPVGLLKNGPNTLRLLVYSKFLVNKGFNPNNFKVAPVSELDKTKYLDELKNNLSKFIIPILCLVLTVVSFPLLAPKHLWNSQLMIFLIGLSSFVLGICRGRSAYHFFDMLDVYKATLVSSVLTIWLVTVFMTKSCKNWLRFLPSMISAGLITTVLLSTSLIEAASWGRIWFHISPVFLIAALYGSLKVSGLKSLRSFGLIVLIATNLNDNLNDLRIISTFSILQIGLGIFIASMIIDQLLGLKRSWEKYFMKEAQLEIDAEVGKQAVQIAHDLQSPLEALKEGIGRIPNIPSDEHLNLTRGLTRFTEICNSLLQKDQAPQTAHCISNVITYIEDVIQEVKTSRQLSAQFEINFPAESNGSNSIVFDAARFKRVLCNLINNSLEATNLSGRIIVSVESSQSSLQISVEDDGIGFVGHPDFIFERGFTTKSKGNGLGLSSAKEFVENLGGKIYITSLTRGTKITLSLPSDDEPLKNIAPKSHHSIILIDDDPLVRFNWRRQGLKFEITVYAFKSFEDFLEKKDLYSLELPIFIDSNLGSEKGELLSEKLTIFGFKNVYLTTGLPKKSILSTKWITEIVGKGFESAVLTRLPTLKA